MKSTFSAAFLLLVLLTGTASRVFGADKQKKPVLDKPLGTDNSLLWQISGKDLKKPSYLFGTIHIIDQANYFLGKNVKSKIQKSDAVILEVDFNKVDINNLTQLSILDSGKTIKNYMSDSDYVLLKSFMEDTIGIKTYTFEQAYVRFKPFYLEQLIFYNFIGQEKESYEKNIQKIAEEKNIALSGLETIEEQLAAIDQIPLDVQLSSIISTIKNYAGESRKLAQLIQYYKNQNIAELTKAFEEEDDTSWKEQLVDTRNRKWVPVITEQIVQKSCFIAVGAGHLGGDKGLIQLLKNQGYTVVPVSIN